MIGRSIMARVAWSVILVMMGGVLADRLALQPLRQRHARLAELRANVAARRAKLASIETAKKNVATAAKRSVGTTVCQARVAYQQWLLNLASRLGIDGALVLPGAPRETGFGQRLPFRIEACAQQDQIGAFVRTIYAADALHRISELTLTPNVGRYRLEMSLEALHVAGEDTHADAIMSDLHAAAATKSQPFFADHDLFARPKPKLKSVVVKSSTNAPPLISLQFVATFFQDGQRYAWLLDTQTDTEYSVTEDENLVVHSCTLYVSEIGKDFVTFERNGSVHRVNLGDETQLASFE